MKNKFISTLSISILFASIFSQNDFNHNEKSKSILEKVSNAYQKNSSTKFNFKLTILSQDINETQNGYALVKDEKFYYKTEEREVICNGNVVWTFFPEDNECYIDLLEDVDNSINPNEIFTIWKKGFKFQYIKEYLIKGEKIHEIKMFPENPSKSKYHTLLMEINENKSSIQQAIIKSKDGVTIKFEIIDMSANPSLEKDTFVWNKSNYPNVDEIDNR